MKSPQWRRYIFNGEGISDIQVINVLCQILIADFEYLILNLIFILKIGPS
jgi:hypothetical protein